MVVLLPYKTQEKWAEKGEVCSEVSQCILTLFFGEHWLSKYYPHTLSSVLNAAMS